ncbi:methicillin resistance protein FmtA [Staphylococcus lutrae]|uniref:Methicillin resistance protein FmtA n=1 Tax=Staphylococcus lutrae TaxID=155085 RepID=A0AAC9RT58_9STAP|nr:serine hydrolase domain-containing protein [Staphylococcus lutrae]ARJ51334.1 methicillin resistance protein FmtA [Staphylococcus lutrae]PNZ35844.1 methicillin resistance protein FmtA [Staphylococcus lutrae]
MNKGKKSLLTYLLIGGIVVAILAGCFYLYHQIKAINDMTHVSIEDTSQQKNKQTAEGTDEIPPLKTVYNSENPASQKIDQYLQHAKFNGTIAVFENGQLMMNKGYGYQDFESGKKNDPNTLYLIGSAQKFLTGMMVKKLELENKVNVNDPVSKYISGFEFHQKLTIEDLLRHRSGFYKYQGSDKILDLNGAIKEIHQRGIDPKFYHKHFYNDANYLVLAKVIENVTHQSYVKNYYHFIGNPLELTHSAFFNDTRYDEHFAKGYGIDKKTNAPYYRPPQYLDQYYGAGNIYMSAHDMGVLVRSLQTNQMFPQDVTHPYLHELMTKRYPEKYRYGFYVYNDKNRINGIFFGHIFTTYFNDQYIVVLATNDDQPNPNNNEAKIKHIYYNILNQRAIINQPGVTVGPEN